MIQTREMEVTSPKKKKKKN